MKSRRRTSTCRPRLSSPSACFGVLYSLLFFPATSTAEEARDMRPQEQRALSELCIRGTELDAVSKESLAGRIGTERADLLRASLRSRPSPALSRSPEDLRRAHALFDAHYSTANPYCLQPERRPDDETSSRCIVSAEYRDGRGRRIMFAGVHHVNGPRSRSEDPVKAAVLGELDRLFASTVPWGAVVIEGIPTDWDEGAYCGFARTVLLDTDSQTEAAGEHVYAAKEALKRRIPLIGGEPSEGDYAELARRLEWDARMNSLFLSFANLHAGQHPSRKEDLKVLFERAKGPSPVEERSISWEKFVSWYHDNSGWGRPRAAYSEKEAALVERTSPEGLAMHGPLPMDAAPLASCNDTEKTPGLRRFAIESTRERNRHLFELLDARTKLIKNILVVYGMGHLEALEPVLRAAYGAPASSSSPSSACSP